MKKLAAFLLGLGLIVGAAIPAEARVFVGVGYGYGYPAYYPGYYGYPYYYYPTYYAPPPTVIYTSPAPVIGTAVASGTAAAATSLLANPASPTFVDAYGRTCRHFTAAGGAPISGTACLMPDGTWRTVTE